MGLQFTCNLLILNGEKNPKKLLTFSDQQCIMGV